MDKLVHSIIVWIVIAMALLFGTSCTRYQGTSTKILDDMDIKYEIAETIPHHPNAHAVYVESEDKIYVKRGKQQMYLILHEVIHKIRSNSGLLLGWDTKNHRIEEAVAVKAAIGIGKAAGISLGVSRYQVPGLISKTWKVNSLPRHPLTKEEQAIVDKEVKRSIDLFIYKLKLKGHSLKEVDWARTAVLVIL